MLLNSCVLVWSWACLSVSCLQVPNARQQDVMAALHRPHWTGATPMTGSTWQLRRWFQEAMQLPLSAPC